MYRLLRDTHLALGLFCCLFLLMYGISAVQMGHTDWFDLTPQITEASLAVEGGEGADPRALARELRARGAVRGDLNRIEETPDGFDLAFVRPGTVHQVSYSRQRSEARIRTHEAGFMGMLNRIHHVHGLWHEFSLTNAWAGFLAIVSLALLILGGTGIYLWFKIYRERKIGTVLLSLSLAYSLTLLALILTA